MAAMGPHGKGSTGPPRQALSEGLLGPPFGRPLHTQWGSWGSGRSKLPKFFFPEKFETESTFLENFFRRIFEKPNSS